MIKLKRLWVTLAVSALCILPMWIAIVICSHEVNRTLQEEMQYILQDKAGQNYLIVKNQIEKTGQMGQWEAVPDTYGCIVQNNGDIVFHSYDSPMSDKVSFMDCLAQRPEASRKLLEKFQENQSGIGSFWLEEKLDFYYIPLLSEQGETQGYLITLIPDKVLAQRLLPIKQNITQMIRIIIILIGATISIFLMTYHIGRGELLKLAYVDSVTGGDNYVAFQKKLKKKKNPHGYLAAMDITGFKVINNTCGVSAGDEVIINVWKTIKCNIREEELASRIYADRFVLFLEEDNRDSVEKRIQQLIAEVEKVSDLLESPRIVPVMGIYRMSLPEPMENAYGNAVHAKALVKGRRDRSYAFYDEVDYTGVVEKRVIEDAFDQAISGNQFEIWYQPKYHADTGLLSGAEALVRWRKSDGTLMPPTKFIPIYEKNGMIPKLDEYIYHMVCRHQKKWKDAGKKIVPISVNISRVSLYYRNIVEKYIGIAAEQEVETKWLQLEITESATIENDEVADLMEQFHLAGFELLLDDFGSGYSSLSTLNLMHFDIMKLDKSLIDYIGDESGEQLLRDIMVLGQNLGLRIVAEGVENKKQMEFLQELQCDEIQGYYFSKPLSKEDFAKLLDT